ncbi:MAG TPA: hypothetical protein EYP57_06680 [Thermodesulfobacteriaceae bacterium]|nr:hypothetical protein [Thermodesulfobacteriaceae bacterium]
MQHKTQAVPLEGIPGDSASSDWSEVLMPDCSSEQAVKLARQAEERGECGLLLRGAECYLRLAGGEADEKAALEYAGMGRHLAVRAVERCPGSGLAHYLNACLTGHMARLNPVQGLELVSVLEYEAGLAAELDPAIDHGGPDRMLGELYLRAPGFPVSVGDTEKSVLHYSRAVKIAPRWFDNRYGLVDALIADGRIEEACLQLNDMFSGLEFCSRCDEEKWKKLLGLFRKLCASVESDR